MFPTDEQTDHWIALNLAQRAIHRSMETALMKQNLPPLRWYDILWELERAPDGLRALEIEKRLIFEQSNLSRLLRKLVTQNLIEEKACPADARAKILLITDKGKEVRLSMWQIYGPLIRQHMEKIPSSFNLNNLTKALVALNEKNE